LPFPQTPFRRFRRVLLFRGPSGVLLFSSLVQPVLVSMPCSCRHFRARRRSRLHALAEGPLYFPFFWAARQADFSPGAYGFPLNVHLRLIRRISKTVFFCSFTFFCSLLLRGAGLVQRRAFFFKVFQRFHTSFPRARYVIYPPGKFSLLFRWSFGWQRLMLPLSRGRFPSTFSRFEPHFGCLLHPAP